MVLIYFLINFVLAKNPTADVRVLEAPLFRVPDEKTEIIQYKRKGDVIYIHPEEFKNHDYDHLGADIQEYDQEEYDRFHPDPLFLDTPVKPFKKNGKFVRTLDHRGRDAYILREHVSINYHDVRELEEERLVEDPTDYRITEPLPEKYPLIQPGGYRGYFTFGMGAQNEPSYPYRQDVRAKGYSLRSEFNGVWSKRAAFDKSKRFYYGGIMSYSSSRNSFILKDAETVEHTQRLGFGPYLSYDTFRTEKHTISLTSAIVFNVMNATNIRYDDIQNGQSNKNSADYEAYNFMGKIGSQWQVNNVAKNLDFLMGLNFNFEPRYSTKARKLPSNHVVQNHSFTKESTMDLNFFIGFQADY